MDTGKVLDVEPMSRYCKGCTIMEKTRISNPDNYMKWKAYHKCNFNYKGSAGGLLSLKKRVSGLGGRGKLTKTIIDQLQNFYGIAIRQNAGNLEQMFKACRATLLHVASSKDSNYHTAYCPQGKDSWCLYMSDNANGTSTCKPGPGLPLSVIKHVKPIFEELSSEKLLNDCLQGKT